MTDVDAGLGGRDDCRSDALQRAPEALHLEVARLADVRAGAEQAEAAADVDALADALGDLLQNAQEALHLEVARL